jgi:hypothetical protein
VLLHRQIRPHHHQTLRSNGPKAWFRWPDFPPVLSLIDAWAEAQDVPSQQKIAAEIQAKALDPVPYSRPRSISPRRLPERHHWDYPGSVRVLERAADVNWIASRQRNGIGSQAGIAPQVEA